MDALPRELASVQVPLAFEELEERFYRELEARAEETVRDCLQSKRLCGIQAVRRLGTCGRLDADPVDAPGH
jgi:hypothetical protein